MRFFSVGAPSGPQRNPKTRRLDFQNDLFKTPLHAWEISGSFSWVLPLPELSRRKRQHIPPHRCSVSDFSRNETAQVRFFPHRPVQLPDRDMQLIEQLE